MTGKPVTPKAGPWRQTTPEAAAAALLPPLKLMPPAYDEVGDWTAEEVGTPPWRRKKRSRRW